MRPYRHSVSESAEYLRLALPKMSSQQAALHPISYAIWYEYVSGMNTGLQKAMDQVVSTQGQLSDEDTWNLFHEHVAGMDAKTAQQVSLAFCKVLNDIHQSTQDAGQEAQRFGDTLNHWSDTLESSLPEDMVTQLRLAGLDSVLGGTKGMQSAIGSLQNRLSESQKEISQLRAQVDRAREEAMADGLTGLTNRRGFDRALADCLGTISISTEGPCLLIADIDHFKKINDSYGHLFGDKVLRAIAKVLRDHVKGRDTAARFGGEEFVLLLPETPLAGGLALAERIRSVIERSRIRRGERDEAGSSVTISIGVATHRAGEPPESLLERADKALYQAKNNGRNRVVAAAP